MRMCGGCGREVREEWSLCPYCGHRLRAPDHPVLQPAPPAAQPNKPDTLLMIAAVFIALAVSCSIGLAAIVLTERGIEIDTWSTTKNYAGYEVFDVTVTNYGREVRTATIVCVVWFESDGAEFTSERVVTLDPDQTVSFSVTVHVPYKYLDDSTEHVRCYVD